jgi:hypothetical protein
VAQPLVAQDVVGFRLLSLITSSLRVTCCLERARLNFGLSELAVITATKMSRAGEDDRQPRLRCRWRQCRPLSHAVIVLPLCAVFAQSGGCMVK